MANDAKKVIRLDYKAYLADMDKLYDTTDEAAAALTADELSQWQALLTKAAGKHIAFASA